MESFNLLVTTPTHEEVAKTLGEDSADYVPGRWLRLRCDEPFIDQHVAVNFVAAEGEPGTAESIGARIIEAAYGA